MDDIICTRRGDLASQLARSVVSGNSRSKHTLQYSEGKKTASTQLGSENVKMQEEIETLQPSASLEKQNSRSRYLFLARGSPFTGNRTKKYPSSLKALRGTKGEGLSRMFCVSQKESRIYRQSFLLVSYK